MAYDNYKNRYLQLS